MLRLFRFAEPPPASLPVLIDGHAVPVALRRRPGTRRMTLRVQAASGDVVLTLPPRVSLTRARAFLESQREWIGAARARVPARIAFAPGTAVPLRGEPHRILHRAGARLATRVEQDACGAAVIAVGGDDLSVPGRIGRFLAAEAARDLRAAAARHAERLGVSIVRITLRDTRSRWGSCSSRGALSFSWRLILAPPSVLDYLAAHEVAHLRELNHSARFWAILREICPGTDEAEAWLTRHGAGLHRYG